jgi:hypothetical protein
MAVVEVESGTTPITQDGMATLEQFVSSGELIEYSHLLTQQMLPLDN